VITHRIRRLVAVTDADRAYNRTQVALDVPWRRQDFLSLDFEATGLDVRRDSIVAYGAVPVVAGRIQPGHALEGYVRPTRPMTTDALRVHCLHTRDLQGAPPLADAVAALVPALTGRVLIAHCGWIEQGLLRRAMSRTSAAAYHSPIVDTALLARHCLPLPSTDGCTVGLEWLAHRLAMPVHTPHEALGDALTTAGVFLALVHRLESERGLLTVRDLLALGGS
jgi:DNA polymerase III subunit epsilon